MLRVVRTSTVLFSVVLHGSLAGALCQFSGEPSAGEEPVYHVSLAEFAPPPQPSAPLPVEAAAEPPAPPPADPEPAPRRSRRRPRSRNRRQRPRLLPRRLKSKR